MQAGANPRFSAIFNQMLWSAWGYAQIRIPGNPLCSWKSIMLHGEKCPLCFHVGPDSISYWPDSTVLSLLGFWMFKDRLIGFCLILWIKISNQSLAKMLLYIPCLGVELCSEDSKFWKQHNLSFWKIHELWYQYIEGSVNSQTREFCLILTDLEFPKLFWLLALVFH